MLIEFSDSCNGTEAILKEANAEKGLGNVKCPNCVYFGGVGVRQEEEHCK